MNFRSNLLIKLDRVGARICFFLYKLTIYYLNNFKKNLTEISEKVLPI